ncbi:MAG: hypothetical protein K0S44_1175 [Bacteroidetes bacterium]|nr:hypothetical protein [Bacteroidota bacterium]
MKRILVIDDDKLLQRAISFKRYYDAGYFWFKFAFTSEAVLF